MTTTQGRSGESTAAVYETLREWIINGDLEPGKEISQLELTRRVGVSRTPLREALRLLTRDGLVEDTEPHKRVRISPLSMPDLDQVYALRIPAEAMAIYYTVPRLTVSDIAKLRDDMELIRNRDQLVGRDAHRRFHGGLTRHAGPRIGEALSMFMLHSERYQRAFLKQTRAGRDRKGAEHKAILDACMAADAVRARDLLVEHFASTARALMQANSYEPRVLDYAVAMATLSFGEPADVPDSSLIAIT